MERAGANAERSAAERGSAGRWGQGLTTDHDRLILAIALDVEVRVVGELVDVRRELLSSALPRTAHA